MAWFANGDVVCLDLCGKQLWARSLGIPENAYGHATSPIIYKNLVLLKFDQAASGDGKSKVLALDSSTGKTVWEKADDVVVELLPLTLAVDGGQVYFQNPDAVVCLDAAYRCSPLTNTGAQKVRSLTWAPPRKGLLDSNISPDWMSPLNSLAIDSTKRWVPQV